MDGKDGGCLIRLKVGFGRCGGAESMEVPKIALGTDRGKKIGKVGSEKGS